MGGLAAMDGHVAQMLLFKRHAARARAARFFLYFELARRFAAPHRAHKAVLHALAQLLERQRVDRLALAQRKRLVEKAMCTSSSMPLHGGC
jgi:RecB family exonuclease